jgi:hypothetical protein
LKNKNTLPGEILQCCRGAAYILLLSQLEKYTWQKPLGYDSKLNVLFCHVQCVLYSKPSGRILKLYYYSVVGKFLKDFFSRCLRNFDDYRAQVLDCFWLNLTKIQLKSRVESSDKLENTFDLLMPPFIPKITSKKCGNWYM